MLNINDIMANYNSNLTTIKKMIHNNNRVKNT